MSSDAGATSSERQATIARRAHEIWDAEGRPEGRNLDLWLRAEQEIAAPKVRRGRAKKDVI